MHKSVRVFAWKLMNDGVLTNDQRMRRHMTDQNLCSFRRGYIHLFRDCSVVPDLWLAGQAGGKCGE